MQVHFEDCTYFFKLFGVQNSSKNDIAKLIENINTKYNKSFSLITSNDDFEDNVKCGFTRIKTIQPEIYHEKYDFVIDDKKYIVLLDHFNGKNGVYAGYFIFTKLKNKDVPIKSKLSGIVLGILQHDKYEIRLKKLSNIFLWKLIVQNNEDKIKLQQHFYFNKIELIPNVPLKLVECNSMIYSELQQTKKNSSKSTNTTNIESNNANIPTNTTISNIEQQLSQMVTSFTKEITLIQNQQKILIDSILLVTQTSKSNYTIQQEMLAEFFNIKNNIAQLQQSFPNFSLNQTNSPIVSTSTTSTATTSTATTITTTPTYQTPINQTETTTISKKNNQPSTPKQFFDPKNMFKTGT